MAQKFRTWPLDCINLPDSYYFRSAVSMCVSKEKNIFAAFGGYEEGGNKLFLLQNIDQIEEDHWEEQWRIETVQTVGRAAHTSVILDNTLYIHGGYGALDSNSEFHVFSSMESIDLEDFSCKKIGYKSVVANVERRWHQSFSIENKIFVHGGWNDGGPLSDTIYFDLGTREWKTVTFSENCIIPKPRRWHTLTRMSNSNAFLLFGGFDGDIKQKLGDLHLLDIDSEKWIEINPKGAKPSPRAKHSFVQIREKEYLLIGGEDNKENNSQDILVFHSDDNSFQQVSNTKELYDTNRAHAKAFKVSENGVLIGGGWVSKYLTPFTFLDVRMLKF